MAARKAKPTEPTSRDIVYGLQHLPGGAVDLTLFGETSRGRRTAVTRTLPPAIARQLAKALGRRRR